MWRLSRRTFAGNRCFWSEGRYWHRCRTWARDLCFEFGSARWPDGSPQSGVAHGFSLIPVSGVGVAVDGEKTGGNAVEGTFNKDMTKDEMTFLDTQRIVKPLNQTCNHMWRPQRKKSARVCVRWGVSVHAPWRSWQLPLSGLLCSPTVSWVCPWICRCRSCLLSCHSWECHSCHWWSQDEDDEKYVFQLRVNHSKCCWTAGSNVLLCLVFKCIGIWGTPLLRARWRLTRASVDDLWSGRWHKSPACLLESTLLM